MNVYLAHNFDARFLLRETAVPFLESRGHFVTSRWIKDEHHAESSAESMAVADLEDIDAASTLILYVEQFGERPGRGKWIEFGYALRAGKRIILVGGDRKCVFTNLPNLRRVQTIAEAEPLI